jgi:hypothetical protein
MIDAEIDALKGFTLARAVVEAQVDMNSGQWCLFNTDTFMSWDRVDTTDSQPSFYIDRDDSNTQAFNYRPDRNLAHAFRLVDLLYADGWLVTIARGNPDKPQETHGPSVLLWRADRGEFWGFGTVCEAICRAYLKSKQ